MQGLARNSLKNNSAPQEGLLWVIIQRPLLLAGAQKQPPCFQLCCSHLYRCDSSSHQSLTSSPSVWRVQSPLFPCHFLWCSWSLSSSPPPCSPLAVGVHEPLLTMYNIHSDPSLPLRSSGPHCTRVSCTEQLANCSLSSKLKSWGKCL